MSADVKQIAIGSSYMVHDGGAYLQQGAGATCRLSGPADGRITVNVRVTSK